METLAAGEESVRLAQLVNVVATMRSGAIVQPTMALCPHHGVRGLSAECHGAFVCFRVVLDCLETLYTRDRHRTADKYDPLFQETSWDSRP